MNKSYVDKTDRTRNYLLDCFRILAVLMVLSVHVSGYLDDVPSAIIKILDLGAYGVALYFLLSGYFAYPSVCKSKTLKDYAIKKAIRILPMYYVSLLLTFVVGVILGEYPISIKWLYHVVFLNMFIPSPKWCWWNSVNFFWTMPAFIAWYVISPLIVKWINTARRMAFVTLIVSCGVPFLKEVMYSFASEQFVNWNFFSLLYVFLLGMLAYFVVVERKQKYGILYGLVIALSGLGFGNRSGFFVFGVGFYFLVIITSLLPLKWRNEKFNYVIKYLSAITYSVYLTHWFVLQFVGGYLKLMPWPVAYLLFVVIAGIIGWIAYLLVERLVANGLKRSILSWKNKRT